MLHADTYESERNGVCYDEGTEHEEEEDEAFPVSFGTESPVFLPHNGFNTEETSKAFNAFFDDGNSDDEDEPLPKKEEQPPPPAPLHSNDEEMDETEEDEPLPNEKAMELKREDEPEVDEPLPIQSLAVRTADRKDSIPAEAPQSPAATTVESVKFTGNEEIDVLTTLPPNSPPQPSLPPLSSPPLSPPPPPPLESPPPPPPADASDENRPSSPSVFATPVAPPPPESEVTAKQTEVKTDIGPIDYTKYHRYRLLAQQINCCLEKLSEVSPPHTVPWVCELIP